MVLRNIQTPALRTEKVSSKTFLQQTVRDEPDLFVTPGTRYNRASLC